MIQREWFDRPYKERHHERGQDQSGEQSTEQSGERGKERNGETQGEPGLRFQCTMCGNCCTGPTGYVKFTEEEAVAIAQRLGVSIEAFHERYARHTAVGWSLVEVKTQFGYDCVFLDRETVPDKAVCSLYDDRPEQCRTWPFWKSNLTSERAWQSASRGCPGIGSGPTYSPQYIRLSRDRIDV